MCTMLSYRVAPTPPLEAIDVVGMFEVKLHDELSVRYIKAQLFNGRKPFMSYHAGTGIEIQNGVSQVGKCGGDDGIMCLTRFIQNEITFVWISGQ
jgi:hypothetical protein